MSIISLISDFSIGFILEGGRVSLAHLMEFSHFVDLYVLEDEVYISWGLLEEFFKDDKLCPLKNINTISADFYVENISTDTLFIYDEAPVNHTFSLDSYEYWTGLSEMEKQLIQTGPGRLGELYEQKNKTNNSRDVLLYHSKSLNRNIENLVEEIGKTRYTVMPSSRNLLPFMDIFYRIETPAQLIYNSIAKSHKKAVESVLNLTQPKTVYLPPLLTILLSRCEKREDIPRRLIELRSEFTGLRHGLRFWFKRLDGENNLRDKIMVREELDNTINNLLKHYENRRKGFYKQVAGAFFDAASDGELTKMVFKPITTAIKEGVTNLPDALSVRRFTGLVDLMDQAIDIKGYSTLLAKIFGESLDISQKEIAEAKRYQQYVVAKYDLELPIAS